MSSEMSGVDLARQALVAAREAAKKNGNTHNEKPKRRIGTVVCRGAREPFGLGSAISMMTERGMVAPAADGSSTPTGRPSSPRPRPSAGHVQAVAFNADTDRLYIAPA
ncbi:hypothetical protein [Streptomyces sp. NPDC055287]